MGLGLSRSSFCGIALAGIVAFILIESRMRDEALMPMRLFHSRVFAIGLAVNC